MISPRSIPSGVPPVAAAADALIALPNSPSQGLGLMFDSVPQGAGPGGPSRPPVLSLAALLRWKGTIALVFVLVNAIVQPLIWLTIHPEYRATASVYVSPVNPRLVYRTEDNGIVPMFRQHMNTQAHLLKSTDVLERVLDRESVRQTHWYRQEGRTMLRSPASPIDRLKESLMVTPSGNSEVISVSMAARAGREAKLIVDAVIEEYEKVTRSMASDTKTAVYEKVQQDYSRRQNKIEGLVALRYDISKEIGTLTPEDLRTTYSTDLNELESRRSEAQRELALTRHEIEALTPRDAPPDSEEKTGAQAHPHASAELRHAGDPEWRQLKLALGQRRLDHELANMQFGESHPKPRETKAAMEHAERFLADREAQLDAEPDWSPPAAVPAVGVARLPTLPELKRQASRLEKGIALLEEDIRKQQERVLSAGERAQRLAQLDEELRREREEQAPVAERKRIIETESQAPSDIDTFHATEPSRADRDRRLLLAMMAIGGGFMAGLALAYLRATSDPTIREAGDVPFMAQSPFLGRLPRLDGHLDLATESDRPLQEHMRMIRTALIQRLNGEGGVVLISGCSAETGKTSVAVLLGRSLAQLGKKVLLVEADLHRPCLAARLGLHAGPGLMDLLTAKSSDPEAIQTTEVPRFEVLPAGQRTGRFDMELLANGQFAACLRRWRSTYNFVLIDGPPVLPVADARILSRHADGTIMVLRSAHSRKPDVVQAFADLSAAGGTLLGTVLVGGGLSASYDYYDMYDDPDPAPKLLNA